MTSRSFNHPIEEMEISLRFDPEERKVFWIKSGKEAGYDITPRFGSLQIYREFKFKGLSYLTHRFIFAITNRRWPGYVDHIDGNAKNNDPSNLREVSPQENSRNRPITRNNKSGLLGVSWHSRNGSWVSQIKNDGRDLKLYHGRDFFEAVCRRKSSEIKLGYHINHGRPMNVPITGVKPLPINRC